MALQDYLPRQDAELDNWLGNFATLLITIGVALGIPIAEINALIALITPLRADINTVVAKKAEVKSAIGNKEIKKRSMIAVLRPMVQRMKAHPSYRDDDQGKKLGIVGVDSQVDRIALKPELKGALDAGRPKIGWKKGETDGINIYVDRKDGKGFIFLARDTEPDYIDTYVLPTGMNTAVWDYRGIYVMEDEEVGQFSESISITVTRKMGV